LHGKGGEALKEITYVYMGVIPDTKGEGETFTDDIYSEPLQQAAALESAGFTVDFRNFRGYPYDDPLGSTDHFIDFLKESRNLLYVYTYIFSLPYVLLAIRKLKRERPSLKVILGGLGPNLAAEGIMTSFPFIDAILMGEGDLALPHLMRSLEERGNADLSEVPGICHRSQSGEICVTAGKRIADLDDLPPTAYHLLDIGGHERINLLFSRGCPFSCAFCDDRTYWGAQRFERSVEHVLAEVRELSLKYGIRQFIISDNLFALDRRRALSLSRGIREIGLPISWETLTRIDLLDEEIMEEMAGSGCSNVMVGIESGSPRVLSMLNKKLDLSRSTGALKAASRYFPRLTTFFIWGFPFEEMEDFNLTLNLMAYLSENLGCVVRLNSLIPFQKTPLYERYGDTLFFSEESVPFDKSRFYLRGEAVDLVRPYPSVFASFHNYRTLHYQKKRRILRTLFPDISQPRMMNKKEGAEKREN
jgi:anaerobic magnesium-protoporphyrin IX monomethyl ester cyclase